MTFETGFLPDNRSIPSVCLKTLSNRVLAVSEF